MEKRQIVNVITFIRGLEPRVKRDLVEPIVEQIKILKEQNLKATFLIQYDAMLDKTYVDLLKALAPEQFELGVWYEVVEPLTKKCGYNWTGRWGWDWHTDCGFPVGYTNEQRRVMIDEVFRKFKEIFGAFPRVMGSWLTDSETVRYVADTYGLDAMCNCKEQYGTDGYTMWGGYFGGGYYPSRKNVFNPAQSKEEQLDVPTFRMLGPDPIYQYDLGLSLEDGAEPIQKVVSLEPVYAGCEGGGGDPHWVDWFVNQNFSGECLAYGYAQAGQENSFGWPKMKDGLSYQYPLFKKLADEGKVTVEKLGETGRRFKADFAQTPATTVVAHDAFDDPDKNSVWYDSKFYRINLYGDKNVLRVRDLHVFSEKITDPYENNPCKTSFAVYETLPVVDGNKNTGHGILSGLYPVKADGTEIGITSPLSYKEISADTVVCSYGDVSFTLSSDTVRVQSEEGFGLLHKIGKTDGAPNVVSVSERLLTLEKFDVTFAVELLEGKFKSATEILSENGEIVAKFKVL